MIGDLNELHRLFYLAVTGEVIHNPPSRNYECGNCDTRWVMFSAEDAG